MNTAIATRIATYPPAARRRFETLHKMIHALADDHQLGTVEESLKWNEPSYSVPGASPVRLDWKAKQPDHLGIYFNCNTRLIETFREVFGDTFTYEKNRAILLPLAGALPLPALRQCLSMALRYHRLKKLPLLGA